MSAPTPVKSTSSATSSVAPPTDPTLDKVSAQLQQMAIGSSSFSIQPSSISVYSGARPDGMPAFADFSRSEVLAQYLHPSLRKEPYVSSALGVATRVYQTASRSIGKTGHTYEYSMNPEILAYAMQIVQEGGVVLEIAGATGENGILLGFAGASKVYINDQELDEAKRFAALKRNLPDDVGDKLEFIQSDCFDLLKKKPDLEGKIRLILCRNLIHLLSHKEVKKFSDLLNRLLEPGGQAIATGNGVYEYPDQRAVYEANPTASAFTTHYCEVRDRTKTITPPISIYHHVVVAAPKDVYGSRDAPVVLKLYDRKAPSGWVIDKKAQEQIPDLHKNHVLEACKTNLKSILPIQDGSVRFISTPPVFRYNIETLPAFFKEQGFIVESILVTKFDGHLAKEGPLFIGDGRIKTAETMGPLCIVIRKLKNK